MRMIPASSRSTPVSARASSVRPDPSRPATPSTSPSARSTSAPGIPLPTVMSRALRNGSAASSIARRRRMRPQVLDAPAEHLLDEVDPQQLLGEVLADEPAVAQHRDPVADLVDLIEEVRHEQDRDAALLQLADDAEELGHLVEVEARRRLVEHEHLDVDRDRAGDGDELLHGEGVRAEDRRRDRCRSRDRRAPRARRPSSAASRSPRTGAARGRARCSRPPTRSAAGRSPGRPC